MPAGVALVHRPNCPVCHRAGQLRFTGVRDYLGAVAGDWSFRECGGCQVLWLDPCPGPESRAALYPESYLTHTVPRDLLWPGTGRLGRLRSEVKIELLHRWYGYGMRSSRRLARGLAALMALLPGVKRRVGYGIRFVPAGKGRLLDVGCGNGEYLLIMSRLGWEVCGIEPDASAAALVRGLGFQVRSEPLEAVSLEPRSFGAITLHHVLEHLSDPAAMLERLARSLREGGLLVSISPNPCGLLARRFQTAWRQLDAPRHLVLLGPRGLKEIAHRAGLRPIVSTSARMSEWTIRHSAPVETAGDTCLSNWTPRLMARLCQVWVELQPSAGEEVVLIARKE
jgi:SAM-dependent methyltransferase